ncbi:circadian locomoter output cycles protein kaput-like isoform X2 [Mizuhopecten yessoensis]|uniref:circadian locomoter output cycles protein kaput-like isoform X2 n=1 Tax=Mizuhopecten yessoensis TaxID=6573 RepID=UPI000B45F41F|nr:circadian locomoter output cycles protein kaput-like isoform X2 [Mizuhopecten yessoensis]
MNFGKMNKLSRPSSRMTTVSQNSFERVNRNMSEKKRRDQFNVLVNELCSMVSTTNKKMDKSTVLKSTIAYLKNYQETEEQAQANEIKEDWKPSFLSNNEFTHLMLEALDSCLLVFTQQGSILYVSESITSLLGHLPNDLVNKYVYSYIHENEKQNLYNKLFHFSMLSPEEMENEKNQLNFSCHFQRGSLTAKETDVYESVTFTGFQHWNVVTDDDDDSQSRAPTPTNCFCCTVRLKSSQFIREMAVIDESQSEFTSRHSLEWKFLFLDHRASPIIGYLPFEVLGTSGFDYYHPDDLEPLVKCHEQLMQIGKGMSCFYRFLTKGQQWIWLKSRYYITYHQWNSKPEFIVCTNTVVSYADVRAHVRKENGEEGQNAPENRKRTQSPSMSSVTSVLSSHSGKTSDKDNLDNAPHSTSIKDPTGSVTPQLQQLLQQRINQQKALEQQQQLSTQIQLLPQPSLVTGLLAGKVTTFTNLPSGLGLTQQVKTQSVPSPHCNLPVMTVIPTKQPSPAIQAQQVQMTPVQRQLHSQLLQKHKLLQQAILKQQEELQLINQQLSLFPHTVLPVFPVTASIASVTAMPGILMTSVPAQSTQAPLTFQPALHTPVQSALDQQQYIPLQFLQQDNEIHFSNGTSSTGFSLT